MVSFKKLLVRRTKPETDVNELNVEHGTTFRQEIAQDVGNAATDIIEAEQPQRPSHDIPTKRDLIFTEENEEVDGSPRSFPHAAIHDALINGEVAHALELIQDGADVNERGPNQRAPLHLAAMNGYKAAAETLLRHGAEPDPVDKDFWTPLVLACGHGQTMLVDLLLSHGANIDYQDDEGWTPLHQAVSRHYDIVRLLLERGANTNLKTIEGWTPLEYARQRSNTQIYQALLAHEQTESDEPGLCASCREVSFASLSLPSQDHYDNVRNDFEVISGYRHSESVKVLRESAKTCRLCSYIVSSFLHVVEPQDEGNAVYLQFERSDDPTELLDSHVFVVVQIVGIDARRHGTNKLGVSADAATAAAEDGIISLRPVPSDPICHDNIATMKRWLKKCAENHDGCKFATSDVMPKRLLDLQPVGTRYTCCLVDTKDLGAIEYCTLSYCWGSRPEQISEKATIASFQAPNGINLDLSPQTYRDTVKVARLLGIRYLWIDALCILQDDRQDWLEEGMKMGDIYRNSVLTIAATGSVSTVDGFLAERKPQDKITILYNGPGATGSDDVFYIHPRFPLTGQTIEHTTWNRRGWTLQERFLSRNIIHFTSGPVVLECQEGTYTELHSQKSDEWLDKEDARTRVYTEDDKNVLMTRSSRFASTGWIMEDWYSIVRDYTRRSFTFPDDKIVALAGMIRTLEQKAGYKYVCGLWLSPLISDEHNAPPIEGLYPRYEPYEKKHVIWDESLHKQLLWCTTGPLRPRPRERAPSWSWLNIDVSVGAASGIAYPPYGEYCNARIDMIEAPSGLSKHSHVLRVTSRLIKVLRSPDARLGENYGGKEPCPGQGMGMRTLYRKVYDWYFLYPSIEGQVQRRSIGIAAFDRDDPPQDSLWVLMLTRDNSWVSTWALVLEAQPESAIEDGKDTMRKFRRVGIAELREVELFDGLQDEEVLLV